MLTEKDLAYIAKTCQVQVHQAHNVIRMLTEGMTVPFISRYRKEKTNNLDELGVNKINESYEYLTELNDRKETVLKTIESQGKLTDALKKKIEDTYSKTELEDIYLPYKPKRRTKATIAREKGLEPLALSILDETVPDAVGVLAGSYVSEEKKVNSIEEAAEGAGHIIAEQFSENAALRKNIRKEIAEKGTVAVSVTRDWGKRTFEIRTVLRLQRGSKIHALSPHPGHSPRGNGKSIENKDRLRQRKSAANIQINTLQRHPSPV